MKNQDPSASNAHDDTMVENSNVDDNNITTIENPPIRAVFANRHTMNDNEHLAWTISCNYQRTMHPIFIHHINRIEEAKRKQRHFIYNTLHKIHTDTVVAAASNNLTVRPRADDGNDNNAATFQRKNSGLKVVSPKPTAVHISILKIQSKT
jgi:hypothetical protein